MTMPAAVPRSDSRPSGIRVYDSALRWCLPVVLANGKILAEGRYPTREQVLALHA